MILPDAERRSLEDCLRQDPNRSDLRLRLCWLRLQQHEHVTEDDIKRAFPEYIGAGSMYSFLAPLYLPAHEKGEAGHLDLPTRVLHSRFPDCPCCLYFRASWLFHFASALDALRILDDARHLSETYDYLAVLHAITFKHVGRFDDAKALILNFFKAYTGDLWRAPDFLVRQAAAIRSQIPPILIVTLPKSGSVFLQSTLSRGLSAPYTYLCPLGLFSDVVIEERVQEFSAGGAIAVDHVESSAQNLDALYRHGIRKVVFHYRDLRQSSLSFVYHSASDEIYSEPRGTLLERRQTIRKSQPDFEDIYRQQFLKWFPFLEGWAHHLVKDDRFEFLITNFDELSAEAEIIQRILRFYEIPSESFDWNILNVPKEERAGHFRRGLIDEWRQCLSAKLQAEIAEAMRERPILAQLDAAASACRRRDPGSSGAGIGTSARFKDGARDMRPEDPGRKSS